MMSCTDLHYLSATEAAELFSLEPYRLPHPVPPGRGMRVAVSADPGYFDVGAEATEALADATAALAAAGIESEPVELDWTDEAPSIAMTHLNFLTATVSCGPTDSLVRRGNRSSSARYSDPFALILMPQ